jgi:lipoate-protein ligase A
LHHPGDVTYSIVARADDPHLGEDVIASYRNVNQALVASLAALGIRARIRDRPPTWPSAGVGFACFEEAYRHEVYWAGRKLVASAQRRQGGIVLQQGTIPGRETGEQIASLLRLDPATRSLLKRDLGERTGTLERALDQLPQFEKVVDAMVQGFREAWDVGFDRHPLTDREEQTAEEIATSDKVVA